MFNLSGLEVPNINKLIKGTCFINNVELIAIIDIGVTHSFISLVCYEVGLKNIFYDYCVSLFELSFDHLW